MTPSTSAGAGSSKNSTATAAALRTPCTGHGAPSTPEPTSSPPRQQARLDALFTGDDHVQLEATYGVYQQLVAAYRDPDRANGRARMEALIASISSGVPGALREVITLGRTLKKRATDVLAYFGRPGTSNGPTEALNGRLEHLRGSALGFRNLTHYIARSLLETGGFRPQLHPAL